MILEVVMPDDEAGSLRAKPGAGHSGITITIDKKNAAGVEHFRMVRHPCAQEEKKKPEHLEGQQEMAGLPAPVDMGRDRHGFALEFACHAMVAEAAPRRLGPPGFEPGTKGL